MATTKHEVKWDRPTSRGDWIAELPAAAFGKDPKRNDAEGPFVTLSGEQKETATVRFGGRAGAIIDSTETDKRAALVVASVRAMREAVKDGYKNDARKGAVASPAVAVATRKVKDIAGGAEVRRKLGAVPAANRSKAAPKILADANKPPKKDEAAKPAAKKDGDKTAAPKIEPVADPAPVKTEEPVAATA